MSDYTIPVRSDSEEVKILYNLKTATAKYRKERDPKVLPGLLSEFEAAAEIAAADEDGLKKIFAAVTMHAKDDIIANLEEKAFSRKWNKDKTLCKIIRDEDREAVNALVDHAAELEKQAQSLHKKLKALESSANMPKSTAAKTAAKKTQTAEDSEFVKQLKAEAAAAVAKNKKLSDAEKKERLALIERTPAIKVKFKAPKCSIIYDDKAEAAETMVAIGLTMDGKFSRYAQITKESLAEFAKISAKGKEFKTALGQEQKSAGDAVKKAAKKAEAEEEKRRRQIEELTRQTEELAQEQTAAKSQISEAVKKMIKNMDGRATFRLLAQPETAKALISYLTGKTAEPGLCGTVRDNLAAAACGNRPVWSLFMEEKDTGKNNTDSYYQKKIHAVRPQTDVNQSAKLFAERGQTDAKRCEVEIIKLAGTTLPKEAAQDLFLQGMFNYGMAMAYREKFSPEKFEQMNKVLDMYGYKIRLLPLKAEQAAPKGSQEFSKLILDDMHNLGHKAQKSKKLALMHELGKIFRQNPDKDLSDVNSSAETRALYSAFCSIYFNDSKPSLLAPAYKRQWETFLKDKSNRQEFQKTYQYFSSNAADEKQLNTWIKRLAAGSYISDESSLVQQSTHHIRYRRYAGVVKGGREMFNAKDNLAETLCLHPADYDPHKETHKFDAKELYLIKRGEEYITCAVSAIKEGDIVYMTEVCKKGSDGKYQPIIEPDTLLITQNCTIKEPYVPGAQNRSLEQHLAFDHDGRE